MAVFIPEPPDLSQRAGRQEFWEHMVDESGSCSSLAFLGLGQAYVWVQRSVLSVHCLPVCLGTETSQAPPRVLRHKHSEEIVLECVSVGKCATFGYGFKFCDVLCLNN